MKPILFLLLLCFLLLSCNKHKDETIVDIGNEEIQSDKYFLSINFMKMTTFKNSLFLVQQHSPKECNMGDTLLMVATRQRGIYDTSSRMWNPETISGNPVIVKITTQDGDAENFILECGSISGLDLISDHFAFISNVPYFYSSFTQKYNGILELKNGDNILYASLKLKTKTLYSQIKIKDE